jgi:hypothetical protein
MQGRSPADYRELVRSQRKQDEPGVATKFTRMDGEIHPVVQVHLWFVVDELTNRSA